MEELFLPDILGKTGLPLRQGLASVLGTQASYIDGNHGTPPCQDRATSALGFNDQTALC